MAAKIRRITFTSVVLPTPGPPVITMTLEARAMRAAFFWLSAKARPVFPSTQGIALSASIRGQSGFPSVSVLSFAAMVVVTRSQVQKAEDFYAARQAAQAAQAAKPVSDAAGGTTRTAAARRSAGDGVMNTAYVVSR